MNKGPRPEKVEQMFDSIAPSYDRLNHILSLDFDKIWRRRALKCIVDRAGKQNILDIACGTGDFSIEIAKHSHPGTIITGLDLSEGMLAVMASKVSNARLDDRISTIHGNCETMAFEDGSFDRVTVEFGIRNVENRELALREILRVLRPGGRFVMLELSVPANPVIKWGYNLYFTRILPLIGGKISGDINAYSYLPASVLKFPGKKEWMATMTECGFCNVQHRAFSLGICRMYTGEKKL